MANYFSNHSQSRFLANSITTTQSSASLSQTSSPSTSTPTSASPRSRIPSSKHFSTTVSTVISSERSKEISPSTTTPSGVAVHPLRNTWVFWFRQQRAPGNKIVSYEEGIKKISAFSSVESFWSLWTHLSPPSALQPTTDYLLFHSGIRRPVWEDPVNISGGKWIVRLRKGVADRLWEDLILAIIGDQFDGCHGEPKGKISWEDKRDSSGSDWPEIWLTQMQKFERRSGIRSGRCSIYPPRPSWSINPITIRCRTIRVSDTLLLTEQRLLDTYNSIWI